MYGKEVFIAAHQVYMAAVNGFIAAEGSSPLNLDHVHLDACSCVVRWAKLQKRITAADHPHTKTPQESIDQVIRYYSNEEMSSWD